MDYSDEKDMNFLSKLDKEILKNLTLEKIVELK